MNFNKKSLKKRLPGYFLLSDLSAEPDDLEDELSDPLFLDPLLTPEAGLVDLPDERPEGFPEFTLDLELEPDEKDSFREP